MKKLLLIGTVLLTANSAVANVYDILTWGSGSISGGQKLDLVGGFQSNQNWSANNTGVNVSLEVNGSSGISESSFGTLNKFNPNAWINSNALDALTKSSGKNKDDFSKLTSGLFLNSSQQGVREGIRLIFTGFEENKKYKLTMLVDSQDGNLNVRTQSSGSTTSKGLDIACQYGDMASQKWESVTNYLLGAPIAANSQTLVSFDITATSGSNALVLCFDRLNGAPVFASAIDFIAIGAIPEPSAFGMLAGLGALAFVGARRRRNRR